MINETTICGFCNKPCVKLDVVLLKDDKLYYAYKHRCPSCNYTIYELSDFICGKENPEKFNYFLPKAIDISK